VGAREHQVIDIVKVIKNIRNIERIGDSGLQVSITEIWKSPPHSLLSHLEKAHNSLKKRHLRGVEWLLALGSSD
jgi:hypothetical protein